MYQQIIQERLERVSPSLVAEGKNWYLDAHNWCQIQSKEYDVPVRLIVGLTALFSPLKSWEINKRLVIDYLQCQSCGTFSYQKRKAIELWSDTILCRNEKEQDNYIMKTLNGKKVVSFYHNIVYPKSSDRVTIDTHIINAVSPGVYLTPKRYLCIEKSFQDVAKDQRMLPLEVQAIIWLDQKKIQKIKII